MGDVAMMADPVEKLAPARVVIPAPVLVNAYIDVRLHLCRPNPTLVIEGSGRIGDGKFPCGRAGKNGGRVDRLVGNGCHARLKSRNRVREIMMTAGQTDLNVRDIADEAAMDDLRGFAEVRKGTLPGAGLPDNVVLFDAADDSLLLGDGVREGLFAPDVFLLCCGLNRDDGVPVVGNRNHHRIDIGAREKLAKITIRRAVFIAVLAVDRFECGLEMIGFDVACSDDLAVGQLEKGFGVVRALHAPADYADGDAIGSRNARGAKARTGRDGDGSSSRSQKMAAREGRGTGRSKCRFGHGFLQKHPSSRRSPKS